MRLPPRYGSTYLTFTYSMFVAASAGVPSGTDHGVRVTCEYYTINGSAPSPGSRKNVWFTPT